MKKCYLSHYTEETNTVDIFEANEEGKVDLSTIICLDGGFSLVPISGSMGFVILKGSCIIGDGN